MSHFPLGQNSSVEEIKDYLLEPIILITCFKLFQYNSSNMFDYRCVKSCLHQFHHMNIDITYILFNSDHVR